MSRVAATLPGYASVARASEVLHLAPRSVRDLIYTGRLPSLRVGRLHFIKSGDLDVERRRRLGLPLPRRRTLKTDRAPKRVAPLRPPLDRAPQQMAPLTPASDRAQRMASLRPPVDPAIRRQRAAERAELVSRWAQRHGSSEPEVPFVVLGVTVPVTCEICGRQVAKGRILERLPHDGQAAARLCLTCGRRAVLNWADRRRREAVAARRLSESLGQPRAEPSEARVA